MIEQSALSSTSRISQKASNMQIRAEKTHHGSAQEEDKGQEASSRSQVEGHQAVQQGNLSEYRDHPTNLL